MLVFSSEHIRHLPSLGRTPVLIINKQIHSAPQQDVTVRLPSFLQHVQKDFVPTGFQVRTVYTQTMGVVFLLEEFQATNPGEHIRKLSLGKWVFLLFDPQPDRCLGKRKSHYLRGN